MFPKVVWAIELDAMCSARTEKIFMKSLFFLFTVVVSGIPISVSQDAAPQCVRLTEAASSIEVGPGMDVSGMDLRNCHISGFDLSNANFDNCRVEGFSIRDCNVKGASFRNVDFRGCMAEMEGDFDVSGATINDCVVSRSNFYRSFGLHLTPAQLKTTKSFQTKDLSNCMVQNFDGEYLDFRGFDLSNSRLQGDFRHCKFEDAKIAGLICIGGISYDQLKTTNDFKSKKLNVNMRFREETDPIEFHGFNLSGSILQLANSASLKDATIDSCTFRSLSRSQLEESASFSTGQIRHVKFINCDFAGVDFSGKNLSNCIFRECRFEGCSFENTVITNTHFEFKKNENERVLGMESLLEKTWNFRSGKRNVKDAVRTVN